MQTNLLWFGHVVDPVCDCEHLVRTVTDLIVKGLGHDDTGGEELVPVGFRAIRVFAEHQAHPGKLSGAGLTSLPGKYDIGV